MARVISDIGTENTKRHPAIVGLSEVENKQVIIDLINDSSLADKNYNIIHYDSPDKRGIDVALLYRKEFFQPTTFSNIPLYVFQKESISKTNKEELTDDVEVVSSKNKRQ